MRRAVLPMVAGALAVVSLAGPVSLGSRARADAVSAPPDDCAAGSFGVTSHSGTYCQPTTCATAADCEARVAGSDVVRTLICRPEGLCLATESYVPGGMGSFADPSPLERVVARGPCASDAECASPSRCEVVPRCLQPNLPELIAHQAGCSCTVAGPSGAGSRTPFAAAGAACALALSWAVRSRARRASGRTSRA